MSEFKKLLLNNLSDELTEEDKNLLPSGFQAIGDIAVINLKPEVTQKAKKISETILREFPRFKTVCLKKSGIDGIFRTPRLEAIAGEKETETLHKENSCVFKLDVKKTMWCQGNLTERNRIARLVQEGETVIDFFAGVGYFSIPIAVIAKPKKIYSIELNPLAFRYLKQNAWLNKVADKIEAINGDCVTEVQNLVEKGVKADRILLGLLPAPKHALPTAMQAIKKNGFIHYEGIAAWMKEPTELINDVKNAAENAGRKVEVKKIVRVKSFGPKKEHVVLDVTVS